MAVINGDPVIRGTLGSLEPFSSPAATCGEAAAAAGAGRLREDAAAKRGAGGIRIWTLRCSRARASFPSTW